MRPQYTGCMALLRTVGTTLEMIKWEHSIFALPFALSGAMLAAAGWPEWRKVFWIVVCMVTARSAAMQRIIQKTLRPSGHPAAASIAPASAKGRAKMECSHLIISSVVPTLRSKAMCLV